MQTIDLPLLLKIAAQAPALAVPAVQLPAPNPTPLRIGVARDKAVSYTHLCERILRHRSADTPCGYVRNIGREGEQATVLTLAELAQAQVDMFTTVFVGNSQTKLINGKLVTPRGYKNV